MIIVDTTVWIDFFRDCQEPHVSVLESLIRKKDNLCICGIILTEVLQGIREERDYEKTKNLFDKLIFL